MSGRVNQPNRIDTWLLAEDEKPLTITEDPKIPNAATIVMRCQDHTMGNMIRAQLLLDPTVLFAGYKVPHPLENSILLKIQTDEKSNPADALKRACNLLIAQTLNIKAQFVEQARNIEIGMGPDVGMGGLGAGGVGVGAAGMYDPYADGLGAGTGTGMGTGAGVGGGGGQGQDIYDF